MLRTHLLPYNTPKSEFLPRKNAAGICWKLYSRSGRFHSVIVCRVRSPTMVSVSDASRASIKRAPKLASWVRDRSVPVFCHCCLKPAAAGRSTRSIWSLVSFLA
jgi:hypothetical protein